MRQKPIFWMIASNRMIKATWFSDVQNAAFGSSRLTDAIQCNAGIYLWIIPFEESYCKYLWCWLCRSKVDAKHYLPFNPLGCPGLGAEFNTKQEWPWHKICFKRVYICLAYFLLGIVCVLIFPFFVPFIIMSKYHTYTRVNQLITNISGGRKYIEIPIKIVLYLLLLVIFLIMAVLTVFPGLPILCCS